MPRNGNTNAWTNVLMCSESGTSLLELMGAMVAGLVVLGATLQSLSYFQQAFVRQQYRITQQQDLRLGLEVFEQELRLAGFGSLSIILSDAVEFTANIHGLMTNVTSAALTGQTTLAVDDGRGWPDGKLVRICWSGQCERFTLARAGQRNLLTLVEPVAHPIPAGASVSGMNRIRYYSRTDDRGLLRLLRQVDGGASVLIGDIKGMALSYWNEQGSKTTQPELVRRILIEISLPHRVEKREISLRT
jgi:hypothetical protein